jgi:DNA-binding NarL/FixJ family response regulator
MRSCLIADDHALMRGALSALVSSLWPDIIIVEADSFPEAWERAKQHPDLCLVDLSMPGSEPLAGIKAVRVSAPDARIFVVTGIEDDAILSELVVSGVSGFAQKTTAPSVLKAAIELVAAGGRYLPPRVAELLEVAEATNARLNQRTLTDRQMEVVQLLAEGRSNKEIARTLALSPATAKTHVAQIIAATRATNRTEAVAKAREAGWL